ncbi:MAG: radical SAM protein [Defluviitaleaceae bacterium]|nr:radical SAM protein [Defluviitaleaceae bacterium]
MEKQIIFYGAGNFTQSFLKQWLAKGLRPVCFTDGDKNKHYTSIKEGNDTFCVLPLHEALIKYPNADIGITIAAIDQKDKIYNYLRVEGVFAERIFNVSADGYLKPILTPLKNMYCSKIGRDVIISGDNDGFLTLNICCYPTNMFIVHIEKNNIEEAIDQYFKFCNSLKEDLREGRTSYCQGCPFLYEITPDLQPIISTQNNLEYMSIGSGIYGGRQCNFNCIYCTYKQHRFIENKIDEEIKEKFNILEILKYIANNLPTVRRIFLAAAEISISPMRREIFTLWKENQWDGYIATNASVYCEDLFNLVNTSPAKLFVSLDAGTRETFKHIKGIDCFEKVVHNLEQYTAINDSVVLKYILVDGINCNISDVDGFIAIAKKIHAPIVIAQDHSQGIIPMSDSEYRTAVYLAQSCISHNLKYSFECIDYLTTDVKRLKNDGLFVPSLN